MSDREYASFLIRCWLPADPGEQTRWQGEIEHIQTGRSVVVGSIEDVLAILCDWTDRPTLTGDIPEK